MDDLIRYDEDVIEGLRRRCDRLRDELEDAMYLLRRVQTGRLSGGRVPAYVDERLTIGARIRGYDVSDCIDAAERALNRECAYLSEFRRQLNKLIRLFEQEEDENVHLLGRIGTGRVLELSRGSGGQARRVVSVVKKKVKKKTYKRGLHYTAKPVNGVIRSESGSVLYFAETPRNSDHLMTEAEKMRRQQQRDMMRTIGTRRR